MNAQFEIIGILDISGRGPFVYGNILDGTVKAGDQIEVERKDPASALEILAVDMMDLRSERLAYVALRVASSSPLTERIRQAAKPLRVSIRSS